jgi:hypothetical protein
MNEYELILGTCTDAHVSLFHKYILKNKISFSQRDLFPSRVRQAIKDGVGLLTPARVQPPAMLTVKMEKHAESGGCLVLVHHLAPPGAASPTSNE